MSTTGPLCTNGIHLDKKDPPFVDNFEGKLMDLHNYVAMLAHWRANSISLFLASPHETCLLSRLKTTCGPSDHQRSPKAVLLNLPYQLTIEMGWMILRIHTLYICMCIYIMWHGHWHWAWMWVCNISSSEASNPIAADHPFPRWKERVHPNFWTHMHPTPIWMILRHLI